MRNTREIHCVLRGLSPDDRSVALGPAGHPPECIQATAEEEPGRLAAALERLVHLERIAVHDIAVLVTLRADIQRLAPDGRIGPVAVTRDPLERSDRVLVDSIRRFKGLERQVVILAGVRASRHGALDELLYVGASRARAHLVVIAGEATLRRLRARG